MRRFPSLAFASGFLGLCHGRRRDLAHGTPEGVPVLVGAMLARRLDELLALGARVRGSRGFCHGASRWRSTLTLAYSLAYREVRRG